MEIVPLGEVGQEAWDAFCVASPEAWFRHTTAFINFAHTLGENSEDLSFAIADGDKILALVPLVAQTIDGKHICTMGGHPTPYPALADDLSQGERKEILSRAFAEIDRRAKEQKVKIVRMFVDPLTEPVLRKEAKANPLVAFGYKDTSIETASVDLTLSEEDLLSRMSSRRRRYIASAEREAKYTVDIFDERSITQEIWDGYKKLYFETAGKTVGTPARWEHTLSWIQSSAGILVLIKAKGEEHYRAGHMVILYKGRGYDNVSAILPQYKHDHDLGVVMQWETMKYLKSSGCTRYEIGWLLPSEDTSYSPKELAISNFKRLFGGDVLPLWRGEKQYNA